MTKIYQGAVGVPVILDTYVDISSASARSIQVLKPDGATVEWGATLSGTTAVQYVLQSNDIVSPGEYLLQAKVTLGAITSRGETAKLIVSENFA